MNQFLKNIFFISLPVLGFMLLTFWQTEANSDAYYLHFASPQQSSMILGSSRASQGIIPHFLDSAAGTSGMYNYAMTWANTPYGKVYYESVMKKLDISAPISTSLDDQLDEQGVKQPGNGEDRLFILEVNPWSISSENQDEANFREANNFIAKMHCVDCKPNIEYLIRFYSDPFFNLWQDNKGRFFLHEDGWLEISLAMDSADVAMRSKAKLEQYRDRMLPIYHYSENRYSYLVKTIDLLKNYGRVILVRMPCSSEIIDIENKLMPDFNEKMEALCADGSLRYYNYSGDTAGYRFTEGDHLWKESSKQFSTMLGEQLRGE